MLFVFIEITACPPSMAFDDGGRTQYKRANQFPNARSTNTWPPFTSSHEISMQSHPVPIDTGMWWQDHCTTNSKIHKVQSEQKQRLPFTTISMDLIETAICAFGLLLSCTATQPLFIIIILPCRVLRWIEFFNGLFLSCHSCESCVRGCWKTTHALNYLWHSPRSIFILSVGYGTGSDEQRGGPVVE